MHLKKDFMQHKEAGFYGYIGTYQLDAVKVFYSRPDDLRGVLVEMAGKGCRQFESFLSARKKTWQDFFQECLNYGGSFTRIDLAIDDQKLYFTVPYLLEKTKKGDSVSRFQSFLQYTAYNMKRGEYQGTTLYFGSKKSEVYLCMYEKNHEQANKYDRPVEDYGDWNRYELRLKDKRAQNAVKELIRFDNLRYVSLSALNHYLRFVDSDERDRMYADTSDFWQTFLKDVGSLSLATQPEEDFYEKSVNWLIESCAPTMKMVHEVDMTLGNQELSDMIINAELSERHQKMMDVHLARVSDMVC